MAVFAKAPVAGAVKTRLVPLLGAQAAASLHAALARRALATAVAAGVGPVELWCAPDETHEFFVQCAAEFPVALRRQAGGDLGDRMRHAFEQAFASNAALVLIGSDCPALTPVHVRTAAEALRTHGAAVAPAEDGGYVLIALAAPVEALFERMAWGGTGVMAETRRRLNAAAAWRELETLWDVDRPEDYARLRSAGFMVEAGA